MTELNRKALSYALTLLGRKRYAKVQLERKLINRGFPEEEVKAVLHYCEERGYINDYDFARFWVEDRLRFKPMGRWRLRGELFQHGIEAEVVDRVLEELLPEEQEVALAEEIIRAKAAKAGPGELKGRKLFDFLRRRGFSPEVIRRAAGALGITFSEVDQT